MMGSACRKLRKLLVAMRICSVFTGVSSNILSHSIEGWVAIFHTSRVARNMCRIDMYDNVLVHPGRGAYGLSARTSGDGYDTTTVCKREGI